MALFEDGYTNRIVPDVGCVTVNGDTDVVFSVDFKRYALVLIYYAQDIVDLSCT